MNHLIIGQQNVCNSSSYINNFPFLISQQVDLYVISEPPRNVPSTELKLPVYHVTSSRTMIIVINTDLQVEFLPAESNVYVTSIYLPTHDIKIHSVYIPPCLSKYLRVAESLVTPLFARKSPRSLILGDVNATLSELGDTDSTLGIKLSSFFSVNEWTLLNTPSVPTRKEGKTAIDWSVVSSSIKDNFKWKCIKHDKSISDHCLILIESNLVQQYVKLNNFNFYIDIKTFLAHLDTYSRDQLVGDFPSCTATAVDLAIRTRLSKRKKPFYNERCIESKKLVNSLRRKVAKLGALYPDLIKQLNDASKRHSKIVKEAKDSHWANEVKKCSNVGDIFKLIRRNVISRSEVSCILNDGETITDPEAVSKLALGHFFPCSSSTADISTLRLRCQPDRAITQYELEVALESQVTSTPGHDKINLVVLMAAHRHYSGLLLEMFNNWHLNQLIPDFYKSAQVTLILKNDMIGPHLSNIRPISLLCIVSKIYERILLSRLEWHMVNLSVERLYQLGFKVGSSVETAVSRINSSRFTNSSAKDIVIALDVKGAFNNIAHGAIVRRCVSIGIPPGLTNVILDYLTHRRATCKLYPSFSVPLNQGVPQGSVLGPFLFGLTFDVFLDAMAKLASAAQLDATVTAFADDCTIVIKRQTNHGVAAGSVLWLLNQADMVLKHMGLSLNPSKIQLITGPFLPDITFNNTTIKLQSSGEILGVTFQDSGLFCNHIRSKLELVESKIVALKPYLSSASLSLVSRLALLKSSVYSRILYAADTLLSKAPDSILVNRFLAIDKKAAIAIYGISSWSSYAASLIILGKNSLLYLMIFRSELNKLRAVDNYSELYECRTKTVSHTHPADALLSNYRKARTAFEVLHPDNVTLAIYTDGSKNEQESFTTAACAIWSFVTDSWFELYFTLPSFATAFQAERHALVKAMYFIHEECSRGIYHVLSDSLSTLQAISKNRGKDKYISLICYLIRQCHDEGKQIHLSWVKGHADIEGNIRADKACVTARELSYVPECVPLPNSYAYRQADETAIKIVTGITTAHFSKTSGTSLVLDLPTAFNLNLRVNFWSAPFYTNRAPTREHLKRIGLRQSDICDCGQVQSIRHTLLFCSITLSMFSTHFSSSGLSSFLSSPRSVEEILSHSSFHLYVAKVAKQLLQWLETTNGFRYTDIKNNTPIN